MSITSTDVLVIGAGPAGLATALSARRHGARVLVAERRPTTSTVPRATGVSLRTMEIVRTWGLTAAVRAGRIRARHAIEVTRTLIDPPEVAAMPFPAPRDALAVSPTTSIGCPQDHLEPVLVDEIRRLGGVVRFGTPMTDLVMGPGGVVARLGADERVHARFVVGADGPRSAVRPAVGLDREELGTVGEWDIVMFRPDLTERIGRVPAVLTALTHPEGGGVILPAGAGRWIYARQRGPAGPPDRDGWRALLRAATGLPDLVPDVLGESSFIMAADVATAVRRGPGFLVGDAAHRMTPMGGAGMNTAIHDGHELGWRLAWAVRGIVGEAVLESYAVEREPVGRDQALRSLRPGPDPNDGLPHDLGRTYRSPVVADDGHPPATGHHRTARPGERAPHVWVEIAGRRCSTLDLFDGRLTVITADEARDHGRRALDGVPHAVLVVGRDVLDPRGELVRAYRLAPGSAVLVRPDGVVAWRHDGIGAVPSAALGAGVDRVLGRTTAASTVAGVAA